MPAPSKRSAAKKGNDYASKKRPAAELEEPDVPPQRVAAIQGILQEAGFAPDKATGAYKAARQKQKEKQAEVAKLQSELRHKAQELEKIQKTREGYRGRRRAGTHRIWSF